MDRLEAQSNPCLDPKAPDPGSAARPAGRGCAGPASCCWTRLLAAWPGSSPACLAPARRPHARGTALSLGLALAVNAGFGFTSQHYRLVGFARPGPAAGSLAIAAAALVFCAVRGNAGLAGMEGAEVFLPASLLTGALWFGIRVLTMAAAPPAVPGGPGWPPARARSAGAHPHRRRRAGRDAALPGTAGASRGCSYQVVGFVDDALEKQGVRIQGVPVLGPTRLLPAFIRSSRASPW